MEGNDTSDELVKVCDMEFCIKHVVLLQFESVYLVTYNEEGVV